MKARVSLVDCPDYDLDRVISAVRQSLEPLGGIGACVSPGQKVALQVNVVQARPPEDAVCTHPSIVRAVCRLVREAGGIPFVGGSSGGIMRGGRLIFHHTGFVFKVSGIADAAAAEGAELVDYDDEDVREVARPGAPAGSLRIARRPLEADVVISLPKIKMHRQLLFTGAIKNHFGTVPGARKIALHRRFLETSSFAEVLVDIYCASQPRLVIADAILGMEGMGPTAGKVRSVGLVAASTDGVALDRVMSTICGLDETVVPTLAAARKRGLGSASLAEIEVVGTSLEAARGRTKPFAQPMTYGHGWMDGLTRITLGGMAPHLNPGACDGCGLCGQACPSRNIAMSDGKALISSNPKRCSDCLACHDACPHRAIDVKLHWLAKLFDEPKAVLRPDAH